MPHLWRQASAEPAGAAWGTGRRWWAAKAVARLPDFRVVLHGWICHLDLQDFSPNVFLIIFTNQFFNQPISKIFHQWLVHFIIFTNQRPPFRPASYGQAADHCGGGASWSTWTGRAKRILRNENVSKRNMTWLWTVLHLMSVCSLYIMYEFMWICIHTYIFICIDSIDSICNYKLLST